MESLEMITLEIDSLDRMLSRRTFLSYAAMAAATPRLALDQGDRDFLRKVAATLIPAQAVSATGIDVVANIDRLMARGSAEHRAKVLRLLSWARRVSFLYGGEQVAVRSRGSRFTLVQKMGKALSALCLVAFWGDERTMNLIATPERI
jgi:hypothetical protein